MSAGLALEKYMNQLGILSQLRKNNNLFEIIMNHEPRFTKERNPFYQGGKAEGRVIGAKENSITIAQKLIGTELSFETIAEVTGLSQSIIRELNPIVTGKISEQ